MNILASKYLFSLLFCLFNEINLVLDVNHYIEHFSMKIAAQNPGNKSV